MQIIQKKSLIVEGISFLIFISCSSVIQVHVNAFSITNCIGRKVFPTSTPFTRNLQDFQYRSINQVCFPKSVRVYSSLSNVQNDTEVDIFLEESNEFEENARSQILEIEKLIQKSDGEFFSTTVGEVIQQEQSKHTPTNILDVESPTTPWWRNFDHFKDDPNKDVIIARVLLLSAAALYGTNFALVKILDDSVPVGASTSLRFGLSALAALPWLLPSGDDLKKTSDNMFELANPEVFWGSTIAGMEVGFWNAVGYVAQAEGLETIDASKSAFICSLSVVFVPIMDCFLGKKLSTKKIIGILMAVSGVGILELGGPFFSMGADATLPTLTSGDFLSFIQPIFFGLGFWRMEHATVKYPNEANRLTSAQLFAIGLTALTYCLIGGGGVAPPTMSEIMGWMSNREILTALAWTGLISTALTIFMETLALRTVTASEATLILSTEPIWGSAWAALFVGERLGIEAGLGAALILGGCLISNLEKKKNAHDIKDTEGSTAGDPAVIKSL